LSAAFDTIDHSILLSRLEQNCGIKGSALAWIQSYLTDRTQSVIVNGEPSTDKVLLYGVPQGSVWGPKAFKKYILAVGRIAVQHGLFFHGYADDSQLYLPFPPLNEEDISVTISKVQACVKDIGNWMTENFLKLNEEKTEVLIVHRQAESPIDTMSIGGSNISASHAVKNLGVTMDTTMMLEQHVQNTCRNAFAEIRNIGRIRKYLDEKTTATLVNAYVISKLDYCNSLLYGIPPKQLDKLQRVMNTAARLVKRIRKYDHISQVLKELHWLPIPQRIVFKILVLTFKALHGSGPLYISDLLSSYQPMHSLRSCDQCLLTIPKTKLKYYGDRSFSKCAPLLWNQLPLVIRQCKTVDSFKKVLKTHLFKAAHNC
jgi:hypothetical protein